MDYVFLAFAPTISWLFVGRIIAGALGASFTTASAYIADVSAPEKRAQNFGMIGAAFGLGFIIGPALGGLLSPLGLRVPFIAAAALTLLNWLYGYFILPESLKPENRRTFDWKRANPVGAFKNLNRYPVITALIGTLVLIYISAHAVQSNWAYYTEEKFKWTSVMVGISLAAVGVLIAIVQGGLIKFIIPKLGAKRSLYVGLMFYCSGFILFSLASHGWMMFAFLIPYCLGGIAGPALQGIMSTQVPPTEQGELQGALTAIMSVTMIVGPLMMTQLFGYFTKPTAPVYLPEAPMIAGAVFMVVSIVLAMRGLANFKDDKHHEVSNSTKNVEPL